MDIIHDVGKFILTINYLNIFITIFWTSQVNYLIVIYNVGKCKHTIHVYLEFRHYNFKRFYIFGIWFIN